VKIAALRRDYKDKDITLEIWMDDPDNVYVGRPGRVFIGSGDDKKIFHYPGSKFANPFSLKKGYNLVTSLEKYRKHLTEKGLDDPDALKELKGKTLGCFCDQSEHNPCHAKILRDLVREKC
jgi:hypothetical protein